MCELLVKAVDATMPLNDEGCYKRGMIVVVVPDGWTWGSEEWLPKFWIVKLPTMSVAQAQKYLVAWEENGVLVKRREWIIDVDLLPTAAKTALATGTLVIRVAGYNGPYDVTWNAVRNCFRDQRTGQTE